MLTYNGWLVLSKRSIKRVTRKMPSLESGEVAVFITLKCDVKQHADLFPGVEVEIDQNSIVKPEIELE